jgi:hypothetical protein
VVCKSENPGGVDVEPTDFRATTSAACDANYQSCVIVAAAVALVLACVLATFWAIPWPELSLRWGAQYIPNAGMYGQLGLMALLVMICFFCPPTPGCHGWNGRTAPFKSR